MTILRVAVFVWLALTAFSAAAQDLPALFSVQGVAADDVLNIRSAPSPNAQVVGTLTPDQTGVEIVQSDASGRWGRVNSGEISGWVALRFLSRDSVQTDLALPRRFTCFGTEPFWTLHVTQREQAIYLTPGGETQMKAQSLLTSNNHRNRYLLPLEGSTGAIIRREACNDGMSERAFGLSVDLFGLDQPALQSGCCSLAP